MYVYTRVAPAALPVMFSTADYEESIAMRAARLADYEDQGTGELVDVKEEPSSMVSNDIYIIYSLQFLYCCN